MEQYQERMQRLQGFYETGAIGLYDTDDLHSDVRWLLHAYQELRGAVAFVATQEPTILPNDTPNDALHAKSAWGSGMKRMALASLSRVDDFDPGSRK